jgi:4-hydroxy-3-polyprenylbenzoate decarboxylase
MEHAGDLQRVAGARREDEIGGIVDIYQRRMGRPTVLFDDIPGFRRGYRVLANILTSRKRAALTLGLPANSTDLDLVRFWRKYLTDAKAVPPAFVNTGPVRENVQSGADVNLCQFPTPKWHEFDGGPYIGTGCIVIMQDPDSDWINLGTYRLQAYDDGHIAALMVSKGKHGDIIMRRYHQRGQPCPVAVVVGMHPIFLVVGGIEIPYGIGEYDAIGGFLGGAVPVIKGPRTGLPIPTHAEIAFEGTITPGDLIKEGPFGEWTGYYAGGVRNLPVVRIDTLMYRNDPILTGAVPAVPPCDDTYWRGHFRSAAVWGQIEGAGVPGVKGVWAHEAGGSRFWLTIAIEQMYPGHAKQVGLIASQCHAGAYANHYTVVVDEDIDPANMEEVIWAMCTRVDPREDLDVIKGCWSTALDPMSYPEGERSLNARVVIDACRPWTKRDTFPRVARSTKEMDAQIRAKWAHVLPEE